MTDIEDRIPPPSLEEILEMDEDTLEMVRFRLEDEADKIGHQLDMATATRQANEEPEPVNYVWAAKARYAERSRRTRAKQIGRLINIRNKYGEQEEE